MPCKDSTTKKTVTSQDTKPEGIILTLFPQQEANEDYDPSVSNGGISHIEVLSRDPQGIMQDGGRESPNQNARASSFEWIRGQHSSGPLLPLSMSLENPPPKLRPPLMSQISIDTWAREFLSWLLSVASLTAIVIILKTYDGQRVRQSEGINLNAMVSVFTTIAKAAVLFPAAESISQLKWVWFSTGRRKLRDFEAFDNASKGVWGSIVLLCTPKPKRWVSLGAIAMIIGSIVEPFSQQIISFPQRLAPMQDLKASVAYSQSVIIGNVLYLDDGSNSTMQHTVETGTGSSMDGITGVVDTSMMLSIYSGVFHPAYIPLEPTAPNCITGNCTFPDFLSIGVCTKGIDITHLLSPTCNSDIVLNRTSCGSKLPNGMYMDSHVMLVNISTSPTGFPSNSTSTLAFSHVAHPLANVFIIYSEFFAPHMVRAAEFVFEYCVMRYAASVSNGISRTDVLAIYTNHTTGHYDPIVNRTSSTLVFNVPDSPTTYNVDGVAQAAMRGFMGDLFRGTVTKLPIAVAQTGFGVGSPIYDAVRSTRFYQASMQQLMNNVATSITNNIRNRNYNDGHMPLRGVAYSVVPFAHIQWEWLSVLVGLVLLTLLLLVGTTLKSWRACTNPWKSSSLAVLGAGAGADEALRREWETGEMGSIRITETQAKIMLVHETGIGGGWRFVGR